MRILAPYALTILSLAVCNAGDTGPKTTVVVGSLLPDEGGKDTKPSPLKSPFGVAFDVAGNMTIVELEGGRVHQRSSDGKLQVIAGDGSKGYKGDGGPADKATFNGMHSVAVAENFDVYIADSWNNCVRKIDAKTHVITTVAGTDKAGFSGDDGPAVKATFDYIMCIAFNKNRDKLYLADTNNRRVRVLDLKTGVVKTIAGDGKKGAPVSGAKATESPLVDPRAVAVDGKGNVYVLERNGHALRVVTPAGKIFTVAGSGKAGYKDGPALEAQLNGPKHLCVDDANNVYIADDLNHAVRKFIPAERTLTTHVGRKKGTPAIELLNPHGVAFYDGALYVVDTGHNRILKVN